MSAASPQTLTARHVLVSSAARCQPRFQYSEPV